MKDRVLCFLRLAGLACVTIGTTIYSASDQDVNGLQMEALGLLILFIYLDYAQMKTNG